MGFLKRIKDAASGRTAKINYLFGNHAVKIIERSTKDENELFRFIVGETSRCTIEFSEAMLYDLEDAKYEDGTIELNPFKENMQLLNSDKSFVMFKLVASNYFVRLLVGGYLERVENLLPNLRKRFFEIYEFNKDDLKIFNELYELAEKDEKPSAEFRLYEYIFKNAYNIKVPEYVYHIMNFESVFLFIFNKVFLPNLLNIIKKIALES